MPYLLLASVLFSACVTSAVAHADTINFASAPGVTTYTYISGQGSANGTSGATVVPNTGYSSAIQGSQWVSTSTSGGNGNVGLTNYTNSFTLLAGESYSGSLSFMADDNAGVLINGVSIYGIDSTPDYFSPQTIGLSSSYFKSGVNTITLEVYNTGGPAAGDFYGTLTGASAVTPEPTPLILIGTGIMGVVALARRRFRTA